MCGKVLKKIGKFAGFGGGHGGGLSGFAPPHPNAGQAEADRARKAALENDGKDDLDVTGGGKSTLGKPNIRRRRLR